MAKKIILRGLREHNLKGIDLDIPLYRAISVIGRSGAGKSTLVFDTIHSESERRFIETFSPYVRQFLERRPRPEAGLISGLPASIAVTGGNPVRNARSTVATLGELTYSVRHLYLRLGEPFCPRCHIPIKEHKAEDVLEIIRGLLTTYGEGLFLVGVETSIDEKRLRELESKGYTRLFVENQVVRIDQLTSLGGEKRALVLMDRVRLGPNTKFTALSERIHDALELGFLEGGGRVTAYFLTGPDYSDLVGPFSFIRGRRCPQCDQEFPRPTLALFSFNTPVGACKECQGFGRITGIDWDLVVPDPSRSIKGGAVLPLESWEYEKDLLIGVLEEMGIDPDTPWLDLPEEAKEVVKHGHHPWPGIEAIFEELEQYRYKAHIRILLARYRAYTRCPVCNGLRFSREALSYKLLGKNIGEFYSMSIEEALDFLRENRPFFSGDRATETLYRELKDRLETLVKAGVGYLGLGRQSRSLSGGEMLRVALARALGNALKDTLYCLEEPTRGLHPSDVAGVLTVMEGLLKKGNTILTVTHDPYIIASSDQLLKLGPGAGKSGGELVYSGPPQPEILREYQELQGKARGVRRMEKRFGAFSKVLELRGVRCNNLKDITVRFPLHAITVVTGVSGSGKSSLVEEVLYRAVKRQLGEPVEAPGAFHSIEGHEAIECVVLVDQSKLTRTPRATVATYSGILEVIRPIFASLPEAKALGLKEGNFSFNSPRGRCPWCKGLGVEVLEMQFLPDVELPCPVCKGARLRPEICAISLRGVRFDQCLAMTVDEAYRFFKGEERVRERLALLRKLGLGHLTLDQRLNTLSGGEAQRLRLVKAFSSPPGQHTLYILDEPTRSLHPQEAELIVGACHELVNRGNATAVVVEHNPRFIVNAHWVIELGPFGGDRGGKLIFQGTPDELLESTSSMTSRFLRRDSDLVNAQVDRGTPVTKDQKVDTGYEIEIRGARHHNLKSIDLSIPRGRFVVITGPSGSGKSTLAFDIIHAEGERRYIECLPSYMRQFIKLYERPDVDEIVGLSPSVAIKQRKAASGPMSTVATLTEVAHYLRLLYSKVARARCPKCGTILEESTKEAILEEILARFSGQEVYLISPRVVMRKGFLKNVLDQARPAGAGLVMVDGSYYPVTDLPELDRYTPHSISWVFGPYSVSSPGLKGPFHRAIFLGGGVVGVRPIHGDKEEYFSERRSCVRCGIGVKDPDPLLFSFNTETGRCSRCGGTGRDPRQRGRACEDCRGTRLSRDALSWVIDGIDIGELMSLEVSEAIELLKTWQETEPWHERLKGVARPLLEEAISRLSFLSDVGLGYLSLSRSGDTLSGGEAQRIRLAAQIGSGLTGLTIVLDEPTIGLHPLDNRRLIQVLRRLKEEGNSVIVVEHDEETIRSADWLIDLGPGGGSRGGEVVFEGTPKEIEGVTHSLTGIALRERSEARVAKKGLKRPSSVEARGWLRLKGIRMHNLKGNDVAFPIGVITSIVGVSGAGKSTLLDLIYENLHLFESHGKNAPRWVGVDEFFLSGPFKGVRLVDSSPIGRTPRSCVLTYLKLFDHLRDLFSKTQLARFRGYSKSTFSFNTDGGRCPACKGQGIEEVKLGFLPPVYIRCPECNGRRFKDEVLQVKWQGKNISDCLSMTVEEALSFFSAHPRLKRALGLLKELGLGYLELGQRSPDLSGGEAQRLKLARELMGRRPEQVVYLLDEPTTGLHMKDVERLMDYLRRLRDLGNTIVIVEHNLDVVVASDYIVELGPGGGRHGGHLIFQGWIGDFLGNSVTPTQKVIHEERL